MAKYAWRNNLACVATYRILEGDHFLDQFEDASVPFAEAADLKMGDLRYYPRTTSNSNILDVLSLEIARRFVVLLDKTFTVNKEDRRVTTAKIIGAFAEVFADKDKTLLDLAELADKLIKFPDER